MFLLVKSYFVSFSRFEGVLLFYAELSYRVCIRYSLSDDYGKSGSLSVHTVYRNGSVHQIDQLTDYAETKSGALYIPVAFFFDPFARRRRWPTPLSF